MLAGFSRKYILLEQPLALRNAHLIESYTQLTQLRMTLIYNILASLVYYI